VTTILRWYAGLLVRVWGIIWDIAAGWRCYSCGWRNPNYEFICSECENRRYK